jgi:hypothetical protein
VDSKLFARIRKALEGIDSEAPGSDARDVTMTQQLELLMAQGAAPYREIVKPGRAFQTHTAAAIGAVVAVPTTAHMLALYNAEPDGGRSYVIDWLAATNVVSTAVASQAQLLANVGQEREASPTDAALAITKMNGLGPAAGSDTRAKTILNATALSAVQGIAANWFPVGPSVGKPGAAGTPGYGLWAAVDGRIIVPPGRFLAIHVLANVVGETFLAYVGWHEVKLDLA